MESLNHKIRQILKQHIECYLERGNTLYESACKYAEVLYTLERNRTLEWTIYRQILLKLMYLDAYKVYSYKQKECVTNDNEVDFFDQLYAIEDEDDLLAEVSSDPGFLIQLIIESYQFHTMNEFGKINIIKSLSISENEYLEDHFSMHREDLEIYDTTITLQYVIEQIQQQIQYQNDVSLIDFKNAIMIAIVGFIRNLVKTDYPSAVSLLLEIAATDYMCTQKLSAHIQVDHRLQEHIDLYKNCQKSEILDVLIDSQEFLIDAIWMITDVYVEEEYGNLPITPTELEIKDYMKKLT